ncbi:mycothiol synthase [Solihabitans fulvus]|uniref:Mycothiol acetyltransferase n=1 Tax=Solihabitans fulvus TaxID=1892852 RepID=A0A5B2XDC9_9PSEU|nr:mycothiol synthase [Solihabitans fulvus]KAA2261039.1 mycothiol synthase [Solihabitans fulvus]
MADVHLSWFDDLTAEQERNVLVLLAEAEEADGVAPVGEQVLVRLRRGNSDDSAHLLAEEAGRLVGYAHLDLVGDSGGRKVSELAVRPSARRHGVGTALVTSVADRVGVPLPATEGAPERLRVWAHGDHAGAVGLARTLGMAKVRELWQMRLVLADEPTGAALPDGVRLRSFVPDQDEAAVVLVNHRAFSWHPEQGAMTEEDVRGKEQEEWFDPKGFLLAVDDADALLGFHWTKVHSPGVGEVYVVGVDPDAQGGGLGRALTMAGLRRLWDVGVREVLLYVEADNAPAVHVYTRLGFARHAADVQYAL